MILVAIYYDIIISMEVFFGLVIAVLLGVIIFLQLRQSSKRDVVGLMDISRRIDDMRKMVDDSAARSNESVQRQFDRSQRIVADITEKLTKFEI